MQHNCNRVELIGRLHGELTMITSKKGNTYFEGTLAVQRTSGTFDYLPISIPSELVGGTPGKTMCSMVKVTELYGRHLRLVGVIRSYIKDVHGKSRHFTSLYVKEIADADQEGDGNHVELEGVICRTPSYRETPFGREVCDFMVVVTNSSCRASYIPAICWSKTARKVDAMEVGQRVTLSGRYQSREYQKKLENDLYETRTTHEVSCKHVRLAEVSEE